MRKAKLLVIGLAAGALACQDLDVTNPNNPDREVVATNPSDVEALIATSFRQWFNLTQGYEPGLALSGMADELSSGFFDFGVQETSIEPRAAINNDPAAANPPHEDPYADFYSIIAAVNTGIQAIEEQDLKIMSGNTDVTVRALAFAKFVQGLSHGYVAMLYDKGWVFTDAVDTDTLRFGAGSRQVHDLIRPYAEVRDTAISALKEALRLATENQFTLPGGGAGEWIPGVTLTSDQFARLIRTYIARIMVYTARTPAERGAVDWTEVISNIDEGFTAGAEGADFAPVGTPEILESDFKQRSSRQRTTIPGDFARVDYALVGPADVSGNFISWHNTAWPDRVPFTMTTLDERIGTNHTTDRGLYIGYHKHNVFRADRGTGQQSYYFFHRFGTGTSWQQGPLVIVTVAEMDLLKAEGLIRLGRALEAVPLINKTREANGELSPVTVDGVPGTAPGCTPRKLNGDCGSLWDALRYEKRIEGIGVEGVASFADMRGWGALVENTPLHFPIPGEQLELLQIERYTTGGGFQDSAPAPDPEQCPVALTRCP